MAERFTAYLRRRAAPIWERIFRHPFLMEVQEGVLPEEKFRYYLAQDYHYLAAFGRAVAIALAKAPDGATMELLSRRLVTPVEKPLHRRLFAMAGMELAAVERTPVAPTNRAYISHILATAWAGDTGEIAAALLPCPWTYHELRRIVLPTGHPLYDAWSAFYREGRLRESVRTWRLVVDRLAPQGGPSYRARLEEAFLTSSRYEFMFWDMSYRMERWPV